MNVCFYAGLPWLTPEYPLVWMCVSMLDSLGACIFSCVNACFHAGLKQSLYILLCECVVPCWTSTEPVHPLALMCDSMLVRLLDSHVAFISSYVNVWFHAELHRACISSWVNLCFHAVLSHNFDILSCHCVSMLDSQRACISSYANLCFHAGLPHHSYILLY